MLGGILWKGIAFGLVAMVTLTVGTELLASVVSVVISSRQGNILPLLIAFVATLVLSQLLRRRKSQSPAKSLLSIVVYGSIAYVAAISFVTVLPWGLYLALIAASATVVGFSIAATPLHPGSYNSRSRLRSLALQAESPSGRITSSMVSTLSSALVEQARVIMLQEGDRDKVVQLMKDRPLLPMSMTRFADCYALVVTSPNADEAEFRRAIDTLSKYGVSNLNRARSLLAEAVLMLPLIDESFGLSMRGYRVVRDDTAIALVMSQWPERLTVFPTKEGLGAVVPEQAATGLKSQRIPHGLVADVILFRDYSLIPGDDESVSQAA